MIELPPIQPVVIARWRYAAVCPGCHHRTVAAAPAGLEPHRTLRQAQGRLFGPGGETLLGYPSASSEPALSLPKGQALIAPTRGARVIDQFLEGAEPEVWVSDLAPAQLGSHWGAQASMILISMLTSARKQGQSYLAALRTIAGPSPLQAAGMGR